MRKRTSNIKVGNLSMPIPKKGEGETCYLMTALSVSHRATATFFAEKDRTMREYFREPFQYWSHGPNDFSLVAREDRQVIRFDLNRFVARVEGYSSLAPFEKMVKLARDLSERFEISEIRSILFHSIRTLSMKSSGDARQTFLERFYTTKTLSLLTQDEYSDFGLVVERRPWPATSEFRKFPKPKFADPYAKLLISERTEIGPVSKNEIINKGVWIEFNPKTENELYKTKPVVPTAAILANLQFMAKANRQEEFLSVDMLWKFYEWARHQADEVWGKIEKDE